MVIVLLFKHKFFFSFYHLLCGKHEFVCLMIEGLKDPFFLCFCLPLCFQISNIQGFWKKKELLLFYLFIYFSRQPISLE